MKGVSTGPVLVAGAFVVDLFLGDPRWLLHPVEIIGRVISVLEGFVRRYVPVTLFRLAGVLLCAVVVGGTWSATWAIVWFAARIHPFLGVAIAIFLAAMTIATRSLFEQSRAVISALRKNNIVRARKNLSMIVGRDTQALEEPQILRAVIETVAESLSDGIVAPLLFLALGGVPLAMTYKAVNTLDSMIGYRDERYREIGWCSARIDDAANWIPARITGILIVVLSCVTGGNARRAWLVMRRDGHKHLSPNSGIPEAAMAGALGVRLGGTHDYFGKPVVKPTIGDDEKSVAVTDVVIAWRILFAVSLAAVCLCAAWIWMVQ